MTTTSQKKNNKKTTNRISFGSCNSQHKKQVIWPAIIARYPNAFIWGGDAIYGDIKRGLPKPVDIPATPERLIKLYQEQKNHSDYKQLLETNIPILGGKSQVK